MGSPLLGGYADGVEGLETLLSADEDDDAPETASLAVAHSLRIDTETPEPSQRQQPHHTINVGDVVSAKKAAKRGRRGTVESTELRVSKDDAGNKTVNQ
jgi:hypothetical protein